MPDFSEGSLVEQPPRDIASDTNLDHVVQDSPRVLPHRL